MRAIKIGDYLVRIQGDIMRDGEDPACVTDEFRKSGLAKLTPEEKKALGLLKK